MKKFNVYKHPTDGLVAVKVGFSWPAFFFGLFWMLFKKLWGFAGAWLGLYFVLTLFNKFVMGVIATNGPIPVQFVLTLVFVAVNLVLWLLPAFRGNRWLEKNLTDRGYTFFTTVEAKTPADATRKMDENLVEKAGN